MQNAIEIPKQIVSVWKKKCHPSRRQFKEAPSGFYLQGAQVAPSDVLCSWLFCNQTTKLSYKCKEYYIIQEPHLRWMSQISKKISTKH